MQPSIDFPPLAQRQLPAPKSESSGPFVPLGDSDSLPDRGGGRIGYTCRNGEREGNKGMKGKARKKGKETRKEGRSRLNILLSDMLFL